MVDYLKTRITIDKRNFKDFVENYISPIVMNWTKKKNENTISVSIEIEEK